MNMKSVFTVAAEEGWPADPNGWLILGKGPSFDAMFNTPWRGPLFALNHAIDGLRRCRIDYDREKTVAHLIDLEVLTDCADALLSKCCKYVVMPWVPNRAMHRCNESLPEIAKTDDVLAALIRLGKVLFYNRASSHIKAEGGGSVDVRFFSAEAAFGILGQAGVKLITTCGIDGGRKHHGLFTDPALANGRASFDDQFDAIAELVHRHKITVKTLCAPSPATK